VDSNVRSQRKFQFHRHRGNIVAHDAIEFRFDPGDICPRKKIVGRDREFTDLRKSETDFKRSGAWAEIESSAEKKRVACFFATGPSSSFERLIGDFVSDRSFVSLVECDGVAHCGVPQSHDGHGFLIFGPQVSLLTFPPAFSPAAKIGAAMNAVRKRPNTNLSMTALCIPPNHDDT